jgi:coproporphyrinogen III oxidase-like Fe-S oxidoreductase
VIADADEPAAGFGRALVRANLAARMARPQRHRLLHGYPMAPILRQSRGGGDPLRQAPLDPRRALIVGVLPHTFCNPKVRGCGFCTFPHEKFSRGALQTVTDRVACEIKQAVVRQPGLTGRQVEAVYFGGGTANLTPPEALHRLCDALASIFDLSNAELSLEGVPRYFLLRDEALLDVLDAVIVRHRRISMGVQTLDPRWLHKMGRDGFGDRAELKRVVAVAHRRGYTASADLLFNLPGADRALALADVDAAIEVGFDQICVYNLVLTRELGTPWARDRALVDAMPPSRDACATWLAVRDRLLAQDYVQTTLTNFEHANVAASAKRFVYERASFDPAGRDCLGFGPGSISTVTYADGQTACKWTNEQNSDAYVAACDQTGVATAHRFDYAGLDLELLHLTRGLSRLAIDRAVYAVRFGIDPGKRFALELEVLEAAGLVLCSRDEIALTPTGMFYADAVTGLLASERVAQLGVPIRHAHRQHMG